MSTTSNSVMAIYRNLGLSLELLTTAWTESDKIAWTKSTNDLLKELAYYTGERLTIEEFSAIWFSAEFESRV